MVPDWKKVQNSGDQGSDGKSNEGQKRSCTEVEHILDTLQLARYPTQTFLDIG